MPQAYAGDWIRLQRLPGFRNSLIVPGLDGQVIGQMSARLRVAWSQLYAASAHRFGVRPVPVIENMNGRQCVLRGRNTFVQLQRLERAASGFGEEIGAGAKPEQPLIKIRPRKVRVSLGR